MSDLRLDRGAGIGNSGSRVLFSVVEFVGDGAGRKSSLQRLLAGTPLVTHKKPKGPASLRITERELHRQRTRHLNALIAVLPPAVV